MNDILKHLAHLKNIHNENDSLLDTNLDDSGYFTNPIPTDEFINPISRTSSVDSNRTIR